MGFFSSNGKQKMFGLGLLVLVANFSIIVALYGVPAVAKAAGLSEQNATYVMAAVAFVLAVVCMRWAKSLNKKAAEKE